MWDLIQRIIRFKRRYSTRWRILGVRTGRAFRLARMKNSSDATRRILETKIWLRIRMIYSIKPAKTQKHNIRGRFQKKNNPQRKSSSTNQESDSRVRCSRWSWWGRRSFLSVLCWLERKKTCFQPKREEKGSVIEKKMIALEPLSMLLKFTMNHLLFPPWTLANIKTTLIYK